MWANHSLRQRSRAIGQRAHPMRAEFANGERRAKRAPRSPRGESERREPRVGTAIAGGAAMTQHFPTRVSDIMTHEIAVLHEEENLELADTAMAKFRFRHLPVVEGDKLIGLVTERDLLRASISTFDQDHALKDDNLKRYYFVRELMTTDLVTVRPDTLLVDAAVLMRERKLGCLPVTDAGGKLLGIVTQGDFLALAARLLGQRAPS
jgi:CBS domain-containing membrane protein